MNKILENGLSCGKSFPKNGEENLEIQQILECMTNEFNKNDNEVESTTNSEDDEELEQRNMPRENLKVLKPVSCEITNSTRDTITTLRELGILGSPQRSTVTAAENGPVSGTEDSQSPKKDIQRIVLTFRTVDEKTDQGSKTKMSSCTSNVDIVSDELSNCDNFEGVSVKIENSDDVGDNDGKSESEECEKCDDHVFKIPEKPVNSPVTRSLRKKLSELSPDALKRSTRQLSKDKPSVLESAIALKEKVNHTADETVKSRKRVNKQLGRPRKYFLDPTGEILENRDATPTMVTESKNTFTPIDKLPPLIPIKMNPLKTDNENHCVSPKEHESSIKSVIEEEEDHVFLKPDSPSIRCRNTARKMIKGISYTPLPERISPTTELNLLDLAEELPFKRPRRNMAPSPSLAEGNASKPEAATVLNGRAGGKAGKELDLQCLCQVNTQLYITVTNTEAPLLCTAVDSVEQQSIRCQNKLDCEDVAMRRPSAMVPYIVLCKVHKDYLEEHRCCPYCGFFCAQGKFLICSHGHQYHRECAINIGRSLTCPHCTSNNFFEIITESVGDKQSAKIIYDRQIKVPSAKMCLPNPPDKYEEVEVVETPSVPLIDPSLVVIPKPLSNAERAPKHNTMSLMAAVTKGDTQKLVNILASGYSANQILKEQPARTPLHVAAGKGFLSCVHVLVQSGVQIDIMDKNLQTPLMHASAKGHVDVVRYLTRVGADSTLKGEDGRTSLHIAAKAGHLEVCKLLVNQARRPKLLIDMVDDGSWTALIWACEFGHVEIVKFLLDQKCDTFVRDIEQNIALHWSAYSGSSVITELLLDRGSDVNVVNLHGDTPLHISARQNKAEVTILLLARGAKIDAINGLQLTPLDCCPRDGPTMNALKLNAQLKRQSDNSSEQTIRILTNDISRGKETNPIQCINAVDNEDKPKDFVYVTENCYTSLIDVDRRITSLRSCRCEDDCFSGNCSCSTYGGRSWYDEDGVLVKDFNFSSATMMFECNIACSCNKLKCKNRVVQNGITKRLQLFRTANKGWGVRSLTSVAKGSYICEYVGEMLSDMEADKRDDDSYLFDLDNRDGETYTIDAKRYGNISRFINHSCDPNLLSVRVFIDHQDLRFARIALFAAKEIKVHEELSFDYGEKFWIIKCKSFTCTCGAKNCKYSDKTIQTTLSDYRKRVKAEELEADKMEKSS